MSTQVISRGTKNGQRTAMIVVKTEVSKGKFMSQTKHLVFGNGNFRDRGMTTHSI